MHKIATSLALLFIAICSSLKAANPFPYTGYGKFFYSSELRNQNDVLVKREKGILFVAHYGKQGVRIKVVTENSTIMIIFSGNHRFQLIDQQRNSRFVGRWHIKGPTFTVARNVTTGEVNKADFGLSQNLLVFNLRPIPGFQQKFVAHK
jgi:hypothetical protein